MMKWGLHFCQAGPADCFVLALPVFSVDDCDLWISVLILCVYGQAETFVYKKAILMLMATKQKYNVKLLMGGPLILQILQINSERHAHKYGSISSICMYSSLNS